MYTDSHCHLSFLDEETALKMIQRGQQRGLCRWLMAGYDLADWKRQIQLQTVTSDSVVTAFGIHPWVVIAQEAVDLEELYSKLIVNFSNSAVVGEMGLDFYKPRGRERRHVQEEYFRKQLQFAGNRPCVLHVVQAHGSALGILDEFPHSRGWIHGFSGTWEVAQEYLAKGFLVSVGRNVVKENFKNLQDVVRNINIKDLLIESDSPCGPDVQEDPEQIYFQVAEAVADIKKISVHELLSSCHDNVSRILDGN